jgi:DNA-binding CsgD family transcriptional regulator
MGERDAIFRVVGQIYAAAGNPNDWRAVLASVRELLHGTAAHFVHHDYRHREGAVDVAAGLDPAAIQAYGDYYHAVDPWAGRVKVDRVRPGEVVLGQSLVSHSQMKKTEYYADLGNRYDLTRCVAGYLEKPAAESIAVLSVNRSDRAPEFTADDARTLGLLVPHLRRALGFHRRLTNIDTQRTAALDIIDRLATGVILLDFKLRAVFMNRIAEEIAIERDGVIVDRGELLASTPALTNALRQTAAAAAAVTRGVGIEVIDERLQIPRRSGRQPLQIVVMPLRHDNEYTGNVDRAAVAVFVVDPERATKASESLLRHLYQLTPIEVRVALALAGGCTTQEIAVSLKLTASATRWHLKRAFAKTGTATQAQLVRLVLNTVNFVHPEGSRPSDRHIIE